MLSRWLITVYINDHGTWFVIRDILIISWGEVLTRGKKKKRLLNKIRSFFIFPFISAEWKAVLPLQKAFFNMLVVFSSICGFGGNSIKLICFSTGQMGSSQSEWTCSFMNWRNSLRWTTICKRHGVEFYADGIALRNSAAVSSDGNINIKDRNICLVACSQCQTKGHCVGSLLIIQFQCHISRHAEQRMCLSTKRDGSQLSSMIS